MKNKQLKYIIPYLPNILIKSSSHNNINKEPVIDASLLFADLSGFTAMSEKLSGLGRLGGEKLAGIMNDCFDELLGLVFAAEGDIIKFGGDAFLAMFRGNNDVNRAYNCACDLLNWISKNDNISTSVGEFSLGIHAGISKGQIFNLFIGKDRMDHLFCGKTVENTYAAADAASLGQIALTEESVKYIANIKTSRTVDGFYICQSPGKSETCTPVPGKGINKIPLNPEIDKFIINALQEQLHFNNGVIEGEHRILTSLFIGVKSLRKNLESDIAKSTDAIDNYFNTLNDIVARNGGAIARLDSSGSSEKMLIFFGAPKSYGTDAQNCLKAVLEIESALPELNRHFTFPIKHRYGINSGLCFVGDVGGKLRREYTAMGDAINLAARLMAQANYGDVLVGEQTIKICGNSFVTHDGGKVKVKGKKKSVSLYYLDRQLDKSNADEMIIGREQELKQAQNFINKVKDRQHALLLISGEPGAGKSLMCVKIKKLAHDSKLKNVEGVCFRHSENTPYVPLKSILFGMLKLPLKSTRKQRRIALQKQLGLIGETEWEPLLAPLLDYFPAVPPHLKNLPEDIKEKKISGILSRLICNINKQVKSLLIIDDIQWIDSASLKIIKSLIEIKECPGFVFISRPGDTYDDLKISANIECIELAGLTAENSRKLFLTILNEIKPDEKIIEQVIEKSAGNPFYLEEMAKAFIELGAEKFNAEDTIPSGIESVITARIDNLGEMVKKTIRTASVIGRVFAFDILQNIFPDRKRASKLRDYISELAHLDLTPLERRQPVLEYIFKHILTQEVAYSGSSFSTRKNLHQKAAEYFACKKNLAKKHPEVTAHHYLFADQPQKAMPFLFFAGQKAVSQFANNEAFGFFEKVLEIAREHNDLEYQIKTLQARGRLAKHTGDLKLAESDYLQLNNLAGDDKQLTATALRELSLIHRLTADYDKAELIIGKLETLIPDDVSLKVFCLNGKAEITRRRGKLQECSNQLLVVLDLCCNSDIPIDLMAIVYNNLGVCHWSLGKLNEAASYYKSALALYKQTKDLSGQSKIINNLGIISDEMGKLYQAAKSYEKAMKIFQRIGATRPEAFACANLGTNLTTRGYLTHAEKKLNRAKSIFEKIGDQHSLAYVIGDMGFIYHQAGDIETANKYFNKALDMACQLKDEEFILATKIRLAKTQLIQDNVDYKKIDSFIANAKEIGSAELEIRSIIIKGLISINSPNRQTVEDIIEKLDNMDEINNYPELELELMRLKIIFYFIHNEKLKSLKILKSALRKAITGDRAINAIEISVVGEAIDFMTEIPRKTSTRLQEYFDRIESDLGEKRFIQFTAFQRRKIEKLRSFINRFKKDISKTIISDLTNS